MPARAAVVAELLEVSVVVFTDAPALDDAAVAGAVAAADTLEEVPGVDDVFAVAAMQPVSTNMPARLIALATRRARRAGCGRRRREVRTLVCTNPPRSLGDRDRARAS
jgi:hypothetical protein